MRNIFVISLFFLLLLSCKNTSEKSGQEPDSEAIEEPTSAEAELPKLSLAQWSLHKRYQAENGNPIHFARDAKELGFNAIEYVNQLYSKKIETLGLQAVLDSLQSENEKYGVQCNLIMVDNEGDLADPDPKKRTASVENHKKWVDATARLGGHSIRVNTFGTNDPEVWLGAVQDGLKQLCTYAATKNINVIVENHGWLSSDPKLVMQAVQGVNMPNCGTLPDFGNWCVKRANNERWGSCIEEYPDKYQGIELMMPAAEGVSAKSYEFDASGNETKIDYYKMLRIVKDSGYDGYIGVEFEGETMSEEEGILATKALVLKAYQQAN